MFTQCHYPNLYTGVSLQAFRYTVDSVFVQGRHWLPVPTRARFHLCSEATASHQIWRSGVRQFCTQRRQHSFVWLWYQHYHWFHLHLRRHRKVSQSVCLSAAVLSIVTVFSEHELMFTFTICCRPSICRLSVMLLHPTQAVVIFYNISTALGTLATRWHPQKILQRSSQGNPSVRGVKPKMGSKI